MENYLVRSTAPLPIFSPIFSPTSS